jgi:hypothetical protein
LAGEQDEYTNVNWRRKRGVLQCHLGGMWEVHRARLMRDTSQTTKALKKRTRDVQSIFTQVCLR